MIYSCIFIQPLPVAALHLHLFLCWFPSRAVWTGSVLFVQNCPSKYTGSLYCQQHCIGASSWDYGTYHPGDKQRLRQACTSAQSHQSLRCSPTWSMEVDERSDQNSDIYSPTGWLCMCVWRMSLWRMESTIISWHGSYQPEDQWSCKRSPDTQGKGRQPLGDKCWCQQKALITLPICCKF